MVHKGQVPPFPILVPVFVQVGLAHGGNPVAVPAQQLVIGDGIQRQRSVMDLYAGVMGIPPGRQGGAARGTEGTDTGRPGKAGPPGGDPVDLRGGDGETGAAEPIRAELVCHNKEDVGAGFHSIAFLSKRCFVYYTPPASRKLWKKRMDFGKTNGFFPAVIRYFSPLRINHSSAPVSGKPS